MPRPHDSPPATASFTALGLRAEAEPIRPGLHVVATPIGNLGDISLRALATLAAANLVVAEDTRVTKTLLAHYGITTPLFAYHEHNADFVRPQLLAKLEAGQALALVSDAGTPLISDPGFRLVGDAVAREIAVTSVPGSLRGSCRPRGCRLADEPILLRRVFAAEKARRVANASRNWRPSPARWSSSSRRGRTVDTIVDLATVLGARDAAIARELTKLFETVMRGTLDELAARLVDAEPLRGEIVVLVGPPATDSPALDGALLDERLRAALRTLSVKDAAAVVSAASGQPRRKVYARAIEIAAGDGGD